MASNGFGETIRVEINPENHPNNPSPVEEVTRANNVLEYSVPLSCQEPPSEGLPDLEPQSVELDSECNATITFANIGTGDTPNLSYIEAFFHRGRYGWQLPPGSVGTTAGTRGYLLMALVKQFESRSILKTTPTTQTLPKRLRARTTC